MRNFVCAIVGGKDSNPQWTEAIAEMGRFAGEQAVNAGYCVLTGGLTGIMREAACGAKKTGGLTIGLLPGTQHCDGNEFLDFILPTGIGIARNVLTACACDIMIGLPGGSGTLEEMLFAIDFGRPVISFGSHRPEGIYRYIDKDDFSGLTIALHGIAKPAR